MENHLKEMQEDVVAMEQMFSNPTGDESVSTEKAQTAPADTLDSILEDVKEVEEKEVEVQGKPKRTNWKSRYSTYKSTTDATIYQLRNDNANLISQIQKLGKQMDDINERTADADTITFSDRFTDVDKEIFGEDALSSLEEATNAAVKPLKEQLATEKAWREKQLELQRTKSKSDASSYFLQALGKAVPDYAEIDIDPAFKDYMLKPDTISGIQRVRLFKQAEQHGDASRVASFMREFKESTAPVDNLKDKVTPVSTSTASPINTKGNMMSMSDINKYYDDIMKGRYRGNEKQRVEMETKVNTALANNGAY